MTGLATSDVYDGGGGGGKLDGDQEGDGEEPPNLPGNAGLCVQGDELEGEEGGNGEGETEGGKLEGSGGEDKGGMGVAADSPQRGLSPGADVGSDDATPIASNSASPEPPAPGPASVLVRAAPAPQPATQPRYKE